MVCFATPYGLRYAAHCFNRADTQNNRPTLIPAGGKLGVTSTPTRQDDRVTNQLDFFKDSSSVVPIRGYLAWLTFGVGDSGALAHLCWGMPKASEDVWLARTNVIRRAEMNEKIVPIEKADMKAKVRFRDHIEETVLKKGSESRDPTAE